MILFYHNLISTQLQTVMGKCKLDLYVLREGKKITKAFEECQKKIVKVIPVVMGLTSVS